MKLVHFIQWKAYFKTFIQTVIAYGKKCSFFDAIKQWLRMMNR